MATVQDTVCSIVITDAPTLPKRLLRVEMMHIHNAHLDTCIMLYLCTTSNRNPLCTFKPQRKDCTINHAHKSLMVQSASLLSTHSM